LVDDDHVVQSVARFDDYVNSDSAPLTIQKGARVDVESVSLSTGATKRIAVFTARDNSAGRMALIGRDHFGVFLSAGVLAILPDKQRKLLDLRRTR
jgi:hypothetical protein